MDDDRRYPPEVSSALGPEAPAGAGRGIYRLPHQLDALLLCAAANEEFAAFLCAERTALAARAGSGLDPATRAILCATSPAALRQQIAVVRGRLAAPARRRFCAQAAAALAGFLAGGGLLSGAGCAPRHAPHRPTTPPRAEPEERPPDPVPAPYYPTPEGEYLTGTAPARRPGWQPEWQDPVVPPRQRP